MTCYGVLYAHPDRAGNRAGGWRGFDGDPSGGYFASAENDWAGRDANAGREGAPCKPNRAGGVGHIGGGFGHLRGDE